MSEPSSLAALTRSSEAPTLSVVASDLPSSVLVSLEPEPPQPTRPRPAAAMPATPMKFLRVRLVIAFPFCRFPLVGETSAPRKGYVAFSLKSVVTLLPLVNKWFLPNGTSQPATCCSFERTRHLNG